MKKYSLLFILFLVSFYSEAQNANKEYVYFSSDKYELSPSSKNTLDTFLNKISNLEFAKIRLAGHTDSKGNHDYNLALSKKRVEAVANYLGRSGVQGLSVELDYYGETIPVAANETASDRQSNRRVELIVLAQKKKPESNTISKTDLFIKTQKNEIEEAIIDYGNPLEVLANFESEAQRFCIQNNRDTVLQGLDGTILFFKAESFNPKEVNCDCVEIQLREFYRPDQIILNNLNTQAGSRLLETKGAVKLEAYCEGKLLNLKRGKKVDLYFPNLNNEKDYQLFTGKETEKGVDWVKISKNISSNFNGNIGKGSSNYGAIYYRYCNYRFFLKRWFCKRKTKKRSNRLVRDYNRWMNSLEEKYGTINFAGVKRDIDNKTLKIFTSNKIGYINCDRFRKYPQKQLASIFVKDQAEGESQTMMTSIIFKDIKSVMNGNVDDQGRHWFMKIPKNKEVWVLAIKKEKGNYHLAIKDYVLDNQPIEDLTFQEVSEKELKSSLAKIGW